MVEIDEKKLEKILYEIGPSLGIKKEDIPNYTDKIIERVKSSQPIKIPKRGHYIAVHKDNPTYPITEFVDGRILFEFYGEGGKPYKVEKKLGKDELYVIGRMGYAKIGGRIVKEIKTDEEKRWDIYVSRIQLLVRQHENYIEIIDVGANLIEIIPYEKFKERNKVEVKGKYKKV
jgi:hypothetical protein